MPPAILAAVVPALIAGGTMVDQNVQNKAANANNLNQQAGAVQAQKAAQARSLARLAPWLTAAARPTNGQTITPPGSMPNAQQIMQQPNPGTGGTTGTGGGALPPQLQQLIMRYVTQGSNPMQRAATQ